VGDRQIALLEDSVARRIAAGEVIERPSSVVRELLDNSIDAESREIVLYIDGGGIERIRIVDDGMGMSETDLSLCWLPHATSKIRSVQDLMSVGTLGFRGEALSSVAACARMEIISSNNNTGAASRLLIQGGRKVILEECTGSQGTVIDVADLFYSIPARKKFLKRAGTEWQQCRKTFLEKALPFPKVGFRLFKDGALNLYLPPTTLKERVLAGFPKMGPEKMFTHLSFEENDFKVDIVGGSPELHTRNRQQIHIFANNRRIDEYAFVQAVEYGYDTFLPGGQFPLCFVFIQVDPALVDFNIHPAKREARFRTKQAIHHRIVTMIKEELNSSHTSLDRPALDRVFGITQSRQMNLDSSSDFDLEKPSYQRSSSFREHSPVYNEKSSFTLPEERTAPFRGNLSPGGDIDERDFTYLGQFMSLFLLVEKENKLFIIDQHAAHERILYEKFKKTGKNPQELLIPLRLELTGDEDEWLTHTMSSWKELGFEFKQHRRGDWTLDRVPAFGEMLGGDLMEIIRDRGGSGEELEKKLYAMASCKAAVKDGERLDRSTAEKLIGQAFLLPFPRCPHGRPLWFEISKDELFQLVGRIV
jgi:DNA mismatch repair protein MutL